MTAPRTPRRHRRRMLSVAAVTAIALVATTGATNASWNDTEWAHAPIGTLDCTNADGTFATRGVGQLLSGALLGIDLDSLAEAEGMEVTNDGNATTVDPLGALPAGEPDSWTNPLSVEALSAVNVDLGQGLLQLPLNNDTGVLSQYAQARSTGEAAGASGYVTDSGGVALSDNGSYPELATLQLSDLLTAVNPAVAATIAEVADVSLTAGAVAGRATLDSCAEAWSAQLADALVRDYLVTSVNLNVESPTVGDLLDGVGELVDDVETTVNALSGTAGVVDSLVGSLTGLVNGVIDNPQLSLGAIDIDSLSATIDLTPVRSLLADPFSDAGGLLTVSPATGTITVDTAALLAAAYPGEYVDGLNGLAPNTNLLEDPAALNTLVQALTSALKSWLGNVENALVTAIDNIQVFVDASIALRVTLSTFVVVWIPIGEIALTIDGTLGDLRAGEGDIAAELELLPNLLPLVSDLINGLLGPLLDGIATALVSGAGQLVSAVLDDVLPTVTNLPQALSGLTESVTAAVSTVYTALFLDQIVELVVNAQNDPLVGSPEPDDWVTLPEGRFDVSALRIGVLGALGDAEVRLYLGRASVAPACTVASADPICADY